MSKKKTLWNIVGALYFPIYILAWLLHKIAKLILSISYLGLLQPRYAKDVFKSIFVKYGR